jgi:hypothetical protein
VSIPTILDPVLAWVADQLTRLSGLAPAYISLAAVAPLLIALLMRDLPATLWTALFALVAISLCATQSANWTMLAAFGAAAGFLLVISAVLWRRRSRILRNDFDGLKARLDRLEAAEERKFIMSLRDPHQDG